MFLLLALWLAIATTALAGSQHFKLELTWGKGSPDGYERDMIFVNGQYPGPTLEIEQGCWVEMEVVNNMPFSSSIHAHGIEQLNTAWADGVPGMTQRPIPPGGSYTYRWHAHQYGSYFYHAHSRGQIDDGCYGAMIIKPKPGNSKPFHLIAPEEVDLLEDAEENVSPLILTDWRHRTSEQTWNDQVASNVQSAACMDSLLVNGKGAVNCWSRQEITASVNQDVAPILQANGLQLTDKGCVPPEFFKIAFNTSDINPDVLPPEVFDVCTPTQGSLEVIKVPLNKKWLAFDIISTAGIATFSFSIDEHVMWVYAVDGHYIEPRKVNMIPVSNGERYSVFVQVDKTGGNYGIRLASLAPVQLIDTTAVLSYEGGYGRFSNTTDPYAVNSTRYTNRAGRPTSGNVVVFNQANMVSFPPQFPQPAPQPDQTFFMTMGTVESSYIWVLNATPFDHLNFDNVNPPLLYQPPDPNNPGGNITIVTKNNTWVDLVFINPFGNQPAHPIHKHSNRGFVIGAGGGDFKWGSVAEAAAAIPQSFNFVSPPYRDSWVVPSSTRQTTWVVVRYQVVNPGPFLLHCHIQSHLSGGMAVAMLDGVDEWPEVPDQYKN